MKRRHNSPPPADQVSGSTQKRSGDDARSKRDRWLKFFPQDWAEDPQLKLCSLAAQGLWMRFICLAFTAEPYGHVLVKNIKPTRIQLAKLMGIPVRSLDKLTMELKSAGVFSVTEDGTIFSRRMVEDKSNQDIASQHGKRGGNPTLRGGVKPPLKPPHKLEAEAEAEAEAESAKGLTPDDENVPVMPPRSAPPHKWEHLGDSTEIDEAGKRHAVVGKAYLDVAVDLICKAADINDANFRGDWRPIIAWLRDGIDVNDHILPAIEAVSQRQNYDPSYVRSFKYFDAAVRERAKKSGK